MFALLSYEKEAHFFMKCLFIEVHQFDLSFKKSPKYSSGQILLYH